MKSNLYGVLTGTDEDGSIRRTSRTADKTVRAEVATTTGTLALEVDQDGVFRVLHATSTWQKAQEEGKWTVISRGRVASNAIEVNHA